MQNLFRLVFHRFMLPGMTAAMVLFTAGVAHANYVVTLAQAGPNVVATGSGTLDLAALTSKGSFSSPGAEMSPSIAQLVTGPLASVPQDGYVGLTGPTNFGTGGSTLANSGSGDSVAIVGSSNTPLGQPFLWVPAGYISGHALSDIATYYGATFASLGATPGTYVWSWGTGPNADSFRLQVGPAAAAEPGSLLLMAIALVAGMWLWRKRIYPPESQALLKPKNFA